MGKHTRSQVELVLAEFDASPAAIVAVSPDGRVISSNRRFREMCGLLEPDASSRDSAGSLDQLKGLSAEPESLIALSSHLWADPSATSEQEFAFKDGRVFHCFTAPLHREGECLGRGFWFRDLTREKQAEQKMAQAADQHLHDALHDPLTGLPNRTLFTQRVDNCIKKSHEQPNFRFAILFLDLDRFKIVNDSLGHAVGDELLMTIAAKLQHCVRGQGRPGRNDSVARLGGDEFTILLEDIKDPADAIQVAERIQQALSLPLRLQGHDIYTTASIGVVNSVDGYDNGKDLLRDADAAMYRAKASGKARHVVFDGTMHDAAMQRLRLESDLRRAAERGELVLHYQPVVELNSRELVGFEALIRWERDGKLVSPADFITIAEDTGLIVPIGIWVLEEACRQLRVWRAANSHLPNLSISVNVSRRQFADQNLVECIRKVLQATRIPATSLNLEITESLIMQDTQSAMTALQQIRELGVGIHMDDFGTGYSSLSCLHRFPLDGLKIDRAFVHNFAERRDSAAVIHAIVSLAHNLNMKVIAEGLETPEQVAFLQAMDCDHGQGYLFGRPLTAEAATAYISKPLPLIQSA
ncbi:MAG TPA: EAL domain-containing protein [Tepidisphaeraceae bacterium]|nr:EAL domain-containing protein [Tepidisphaeraceae bacterium]